MSETKLNLTEKHPAGFVPLAERTGNLRVKLTNDYLFKVVFQNDNEILRPFLAALLDRDEDEITEITVTNTIIPGEAVNDKTIMLDIKICLNGKEIINIEMQVESVTEWEQRSLYYLCRSYSNLKEGENYRNVKPTHHIGILDFNLKGLTPQFYSHFKLLNTENHEIYSSDIELSVLNLKQIDKATDSDRARKLDVFAKVFKAETWEDLKMLAKDNETINRISDSIYVMTEDERIREQCFLRNERLAEERYIKNKLAELTKKDVALAEKDVTISEQSKQLAKKDVTISEQSKQLVEQSSQLAERDDEIARLKALITSLESKNKK